MCHYDYRRDMLLSQKEVYPYPKLEFVRSQLSFADRENPVACPGRLYGILRRRGIPMVIMVEEVRNAMMDAPPIGCTACRHCTNGCPLYIAIPDVFRGGEHHAAVPRAILPKDLLPRADQPGARARRRLRGLQPVRGCLSPAPAHRQTAEGSRRTAGQVTP